MKIGFFDSGLGGLMIAKSVIDHLPHYDYIYLGDTLHVPYGKRSAQSILSLTQQCIEWLFEQDCQIVITACNTASAAALRQIQQQYLPNSPYKDRRVLGVVIPTLEDTIARGHHRIGLIGTDYIVHSGIYEAELQKINPAITLVAQATPLLVPLIENSGLEWAKPILEDYLAPLKAQNIEALILGCTHYPILIPLIREIMGNEIAIINQQDIIPVKLADYLIRHPELEIQLGKNHHAEFYMTDLGTHAQYTAQAIFKKEITVEHAPVFEGSLTGLA